MAPVPWKSLLVAVRDPAGHRQLAVRTAARLAAASRARITLFHAFSVPHPAPEPLPADPQAIIAAVGKAKRAQLEKLARPLRAKGLKVSCEVTWDFPPAAAIVRRVLSDAPDLVVAESHRHNRLARWFLASTDWDLIRECPCPVWFVKSEGAGSRSLVLAAVDPTHARAKPSGLDERLLRSAASVRAQLGGRLAMIHVEDALQALAPIVLPELPPALVATATAARTAARARIDRLGARHAVAAGDRIVRAGMPARVIAACVRQLGASLLVMGAVSRSGLDQVFIGHTAEAVIDEVDCDLLIVKPRGFRTTLPRRRPRLLTAPGPSSRSRKK
ncbi:MAG: universal stress protein [Gammaproteobacteria bacterium]|nr:MAG: universal stress protein [Gammaproteobacteria bacterium]